MSQPEPPASLSTNHPEGVQVEVVPPQVGPEDTVITYGVIFRNTTGLPMMRVEAVHKLPDGAEYLDAHPTPQVQGTRLAWQFDVLAPNARQALSVRVRRPHPGWTPPESVDFHTQSSLRAVYRAPVVRPRLELKLSGPTEINRNYEGEFLAEITNSGNGSAVAATVVFQLPPNLHHPDGPNVPVSLGDLLPGAKAVVRLAVRGQAGGTCQLKALVQGGNNEAVDQREVLVREAGLQLALQVPPALRTGEEFSLRLTVSNPGDALAAQPCVSLLVPEGVDFVDAEPPCFFDAMDRCAAWILTDLSADDKHILEVQLRAERPGEAVFRARAEAFPELSAQTEGKIEVAIGRPAQLLVDVLKTLDAEVAARAGAVATPDVVTEEQHVAFGLGEEILTVPLSQVVETSRHLRVTSVPRTPEWLLGVANVRGDIVSVVDLRLFLGMPPRNNNQQSRILVVRSQTDDIVTGLVVDQVLGIRRIAPSTLRIPQGLPDGIPIAPYLRGITEHDKRLLIVLELDRLLTAEPMRAFESA